MLARLTRKRRIGLTIVGAALAACVLFRLYGIPVSPWVLDISENYAGIRLIASPAYALLGFRCVSRYPNGRRGSVMHVRLPGLDFSQAHMVNVSFYAPDGSFASQIRAGNGSTSYYHENGTLAKREVYADGVNYLSMMWDREGRLWHYSRHTPGNMADFVALTWYPDGQRKSEEQMTGGQGVRRHWSAQGNLEVVYRSLAAGQASYEKYDEAGKLVLLDRYEERMVFSRRYLDSHWNVSRRLTAEEAQAEDEKALAGSLETWLTGPDERPSDPAPAADAPSFRE